jgi:peptidyl-prolyl cis-trans isomerase B (cyclophilin B)
MGKFDLFLIALIFSCTAGCAQKTDHVVTIKTRYGDMVAILYDETPQHKANFIKLAKQGFYDSLLFHRVISGFMIQGGDPQSKKSEKNARLGQGGPGYTIPAEIDKKYYHLKGALSAARLADQMNPTKASSGSQFYIVQGRTYTREELTTDPKKYNDALRQFFSKPENKLYQDSLNLFYRNNDATGFENYIKSLKPVVEQQLGIKVDKEIPEEVVAAYGSAGGAPHLDGEYTVFGKVIKGLEVIDKIAALPIGEAHRPLDDVRMSVTVEELPVKKIEKLYGYQYPDAKK